MLEQKEIEQVFKFLGLKSEEDRKKIIKEELNKETPEIKSKIVIADNVSRMIEEEPSSNA